MDGTELMARNSIYSFTPRDSSVSAAAIREHNKSRACEERSWTFSYLKNRFRAKSLEDQYKRYEQRILLSNYSVYLYLQTVISILMIIFNIEECTLYGCSSDSDTALVSTDITGQSVIMIVCILLIIFLAREERKRKRKHIAMKMDDNAEPLSDTVFKEKPWLLYVMTFGSILLIEIVDVTALVFLTQTNTKDNSTNTFQKQPRSFLTSLNFAEPEENYTRIDFPEHIPHKVPVLSLFNILFVYLFYPISRKDFSVCFGVAISIITLTATAVCNRLVDAQMNTETDGDTTQLIADILFHICLNFIGWYSRYVGDINNRRGFLDKRGCIETTFRLKHEKEKEEKLLQSIIPDHISSQLRDGIRKYLKAIMEGTQKIGFKDLYIEKFNDVTIVFADICNFTPLTVTLKPQELVETLNDLFGKFDDAAKERHCMRIKILGDCYYCVSGVPTPDPRHAHHAIEMGLDMINLIKEVRNEHSVPVNMRIGVHSGYILSGLIGLRKWQYDIWSKDVTIANHMESSGEPGKVHLTSETKKYLGDDYKCFPVSKMEDQVILESGYSTYLIHPHKRHISENESSDERVEREEKEEEEREREDKFDKASVKLGKSKSQDEDEPEPETETKPRTGRRVSISFAPGTVSVPERTNKRTFVGRSTRTSSIVSRSGSIWSEETERKRRKSVLMDSSLHSFKSMMQGTEKFMDSEIEELPIRIVDRWSLMSRFRKSKVEPTSMSDQWKRRVSKDINPVSLLFRDMEWNLEYLKEHDPLFKHYILASFIILNFMGIILIVTSYNTRPHVVLWVLYVLLFVVLVFLIPCTWISYIWDQIIDPQFDLDYIAQPDNAIIKFFYQASGKLNTKSLHRNIIFVFVSIMIVFSAIMDIVITPCKAESPRNYTYRCALSIMTIFMFLRINNIMKVLMTMFCLIFFALVISGSLGNPAVKVFFSMETFGFDHWLTDSEDPMEDNSNWSHFLYLLGIAILFIVSDRQKEYIHRLDYMWKRQLKKDQQEAETTKMVNKILLKNILPQHVADIYLNSERETGKLFSESYDSVAVMFASLPNYISFFSEAEIHQGGEKPLSVLNDIISSFDKLLLEPQFNRVEKIKIIGSTLMAACGLNPGRKDSMDSRSQVATNPGANVRTLAKFAAAMMRKMAEFDYSKFELENTPDFQLRVGMTAGPVIAGVVGAQKPLYDIWGDTVNVASRMDSTGTRGQIHIPASTALALQTLEPKVVCRYRDKILVKGKGLMETYFIQLTDEMRIEEKEWSQEDRDNARLLEDEALYSHISDLTDFKRPEVGVYEESQPNSLVLDLEQGSNCGSEKGSSSGSEPQDEAANFQTLAQVEVNQEKMKEEIKDPELKKKDGRRKAGILKLNWRNKVKPQELDQIISLGKEEIIHEVDEENPKNLRWGEKRELSSEHDNPSKHADPALSEHADPAPSEHAELIKDAELVKNAEHAEDTCSPDWTEEEKARLEGKKDSGYGSQGVIKVQDEKAEDGAKYIRKDRQQLEKIPTDQLADHYEVYYDRQPSNN